MKITDKQRMDFLDSQKMWTRWCGYDLVAGPYRHSTVWPVFDGSFREAVDEALTQSIRLHKKFGPPSSASESTK